MCAARIHLCRRIPCAVFETHCAEGRGAVQDVAAYAAAAAVPHPLGADH